MANPTLSPGIPAAHTAVAVTAVRAPLSAVEVPTVAPGPGQVLVHVGWTSSSPLELHQSDGGLLIDLPYVRGNSFGGKVVQLGKGTESRFTVGELVFGYDHRHAHARGQQAYVTVDEYMVSKLPPGVSLEQAVSVPCNLITAFRVMTADWGLPLPWPATRPTTNEDAAFLVWGAGSSVGNYVLQVLRHWGYKNLLAVASGKHHDYLRGLGAKECFDYTQGDAAAAVLAYLDKTASPTAGGPRIPYIVDCIGSLEGTLKPLTRVAEPGSTVAIMLPVITKHASEVDKPEYEMDVSKVLPGQWKDGVQLKGTRTHFFLENEFFKEHLQRDIVPALLEQGIVKPNRLRIVEGETIVQRAEAALKILRNQGASGEKIVWRAADDY